MKSKTACLAGILFSLILCVCASKSDRTESVKQDDLSTENSLTKSPTPTPNILSEEVCDNQRAKAYVLLRRTSTKGEAIGKYKSLIDGGCYSDLLYLQYAYALASEEDYENASRQYHIIIEHNPQNWYAHWSLAQTLILKLGRYDEGLREVEASRKLDDGGDIGFTYDFYMGRAFEGLGKNDDAVRHYELFIKAASKITKKDEQLIEARNRLSHLKQLP